MEWTPWSNVTSPFSVTYMTLIWIVEAQYPYLHFTGPAALNHIKQERYAIMYIQLQVCSFLSVNISP